MKDYVPDSSENRLTWLQTLKIGLTTAAPTLGWPAAKVTTVAALLDPLITAYDDVIAKDQALVQAAGDAAELFDARNESLRDLIAEVKAAPGFTDGLGDSLAIFTDQSRPARSAIQPQIKARAERGGVILTGTKNYAETINLYMRRRGTSDWTLIAPKRKRLPFEDQTPPLVADQPEEREYLARGVIGDEEVGQDSPIVTATFAS